MTRKSFCFIFAWLLAGNLSATCPAGYSEIESGSYVVVSNNSGCPGGHEEITTPAILPYNGAADCDQNKGTCSQTAGACQIP
ncbi:MAG: hypothetical protein LBT45_01605 [Rickettsiales bacterium]|jgi:hypothetical protein|nr:hypothetical protein [Rickettsiales bacterium]